jgi:hypothetical protein
MTITMNDIIKQVRIVAAERPEHVYEKPDGENGSCHYFYDGAPSCIIGHAFHSLGVNVNQLARVNPGPFKNDVMPVDVAVVSLGLVKGDVNPEVMDAYPAEQETEVEWLKEVQHNQDEGESWGDAVAHADLLVGLAS